MNPVHKEIFIASSSSAVISVVEFLEGSMVGSMLNKMWKKIFGVVDTSNTSREYIIKNNIITMLQIFLSGFLVITIRKMNQRLGLRRLKSNTLAEYPPPIALGMGIWFFQDNLTNRVRHAHNNVNSRMTIGMNMVVIFLIFFVINKILKKDRIQTLIKTD